AGLVGVVLPVVVLYLLLGDLGSRAVVIGLVAGVVGSKLGGTRRMLYLAPAVGVVAGLGAISAYHWSWVVLLAGRGRLRGRRDAVRVAAVTADAYLRRDVPCCDVFGERRGGVRCHCRDSHALRRRAGAPFPGSRGGRRPARFRPGRDRRGGRVRHRTWWR